MGRNGPRKLRIIIPEYKNGKYVEFKPLKSGMGLNEASKMQNGWVTCFQNKSPVWNEECNAFVLDFYGRVQEASVKNF